MGIVVRKSFVRLADTALTTKADMMLVGEIVRRRIVERTERGVDATGAAFRPYSKGYAKRKNAAGGRSRVDLRVSGAMMNAIDIIDVTDTSVSLGFRNNART